MTMIEESIDDLQQKVNQKIRKELVEIMNWINNKYPNALSQWKKDNGNPENYNSDGIDFYDFHTIYETKGELKKKIDRFVVLANALETQDFEYIDMTNQEFEGRVEHQFAQAHCDISEDSSVHVEQQDGEHSSNEFTKINPCKSMKELKKWIKEIHEAGEYRGNSSCGLHLHMSFKSDTIYSSTTNKEFFENFVNFLYIFGRMYKTTNPEFFNRICGNGRHDTSAYWCKSVYADDNVRETIRTREHYPSERYHYVNYPHAIHKTIEIRGLPYFRQMETIQNFNCVILAFVESYCRDYFEKLELDENVLLERTLFSIPEKQREPNKNYTNTKESFF